MNLECSQLPSPVRTLTIAAHEGRLVALCFEGLWPSRVASLERRFGKLQCRDVRDAGGAVSQLRRYFGGELAALDALEVELHGTPFQQKVWDALRRIPAGETRSYAELASAIGAAAAVRAVGAANGANPVGIVVPCHRVMGSSGKLTGFAGGLDNKRWLLEHEQAQLPLSLATTRARAPRAAA